MGNLSKKRRSFDLEGLDENDYWVSEDGRSTPISDLNNGHLINILHMLQRNNLTTHRQYERLSKEAQTRHMDLNMWCDICQLPHDISQSKCHVETCLWCVEPHPVARTLEHRASLLCGPNNWRPGLTILRKVENMVCVISTCVPIGRKSASVHFVCNPYGVPNDESDLQYAAKSPVTCMFCLTNTPKPQEKRKRRV